MYFLQIKVSDTGIAEFLEYGIHENWQVMGPQTVAMLITFLQVIGPSFFCILDRRKHNCVCSHTHTVAFTTFKPPAYSKFLRSC